MLHFKSMNFIRCIIASILFLSASLAQGETYDPDAQSYFMQIVSNGGTINPTLMDAVNQFVIGVKSDRIWPKLIRVNLFCGDQLSAALVPLRAVLGPRVDINHNFVPSDYSVSNGITGDGISKCLTTGVSPSDMETTSDDHLMVYETNRSSITYSFSISCSSGVNTNPWCLRTTTASQQAVQYRDSSSDAGPVDTGYPAGYPNGMFIGTSTGGMASLYVDGSLQASSAVSVRTTTTNPLNIFCDTYGLCSNATIGAYSIGLGLSADDCAHYWFRMRTFMRAIGRSFPDPITCWGDSLTAGTGGTPYPQDLHAAYPNRAVFDRGIGGQTSQSILSRALADIARQQDFCIWWAGRNNTGTDPSFIDQVISDTNAFTTYLGHQRFLVLSILNGEYPNELKGQVTYNNIVSLNQQLQENYGSNYLEVREPLVQAYNPTLPQDVIDYGNDVPPTSLRYDSIHLLSPGYALVDGLINGLITSQLTVTIYDSSMIYGAATPIQTAGYIGFQNGDTIAALGGSLLIATPPQPSGVGSYPVTASGLTSSFYSINYTNGNLTILPAPLTITALNQTMVYESEVPALTLVFSGLVNGDTRSSLTVDAFAETTATASSQPGSYPITVYGGTSPNYVTTNVNGIMTVQPISNSTPQTSSGSSISTTTGSLISSTNSSNSGHSCGLGSSLGLAGLLILFVGRKVYGGRSSESKMSLS